MKVWTLQILNKLQRMPAGFSVPIQPDSINKLINSMTMAIPLLLFLGWQLMNILFASQARPTLGTRSPSAAQSSVLLKATQPFLLHHVLSGEQHFVVTPVCWLPLCTEAPEVVYASFIDR